jgi:hypothetical protein
MLSCSEVRCVLIAHRTLREASLTQGLGDPVSRPRKMKIKACTGSNVRVDYVRSMCEAGGGRRAASKEQIGMLGCEDRDDVRSDQYVVRSAVVAFVGRGVSPFAGARPRPGPGERLTGIRALARGPAPCRAWRRAARSARGGNGRGVGEGRGFAYRRVTSREHGEVRYRVDSSSVRALLLVTGDPVSVRAPLRRRNAGRTR